MDVKILSMQRVANYGSFMQAYALKRVVEALGHNVTFCDFQQGIPRHKGEKVKQSKLAEKLGKLPGIFSEPRQFYMRRKYRRDLRRCFKNAVWPILGIGSEMNYDYSGDMMIVGSDEVFNYTQNHGFAYVPAFFGHGVNTKAIISYAASAGYATQQDIENDGMGPEIAAGLVKFDALGVRDRNTFEIVERYSGKVPHLVIDPTLIYDFDQELPAAKRTGDYLLVYAYEGRLESSHEVSAIVACAASRGLKIVSAGSYHHWCDENLIVGPFELLALFRDARCVVTDTFHGTIFAIKSRKPFVSFIREEHSLGSNSKKLGFLLHQLGLEDRIVSDSARLWPQLEQEIDYERVHRSLTELRDESMAFLSASLAGEQAAD